MKVVSLSKHNFAHRRGKESQSEFVAHYMSIEHTEIIKEIAEKNRLDFEVATAYAYAMFCALDDSMVFHVDVELPGFKISVSDKDKNIKAWQGLLKGKKVGQAHKVVKARLAIVHEMIAKDPERFIVKRKPKTYSSEDEEKAHLAFLRHLKTLPCYQNMLESRKQKRKERLEALAAPKRAEKLKRSKRNKKNWAKRKLIF